MRRAALGLVAMLGCSTGSMDGGAATLGAADSTTGGDTESAGTGSTEATGPASTDSTGTATTSDGSAATVDPASGTSTTTTGASSSDGSTTGGPSVPDYLLSIDDQGVVARLLRVDTNTGLGDELCLLEPDLNYNSLAFSRDGILYAHSVNAMAIDRVDPCTCETLRLVEGLPGNVQLTADEANGLFGLDLTADELVRINPATGIVTVVGAVGLDFESLGIAYSDAARRVYALTGATDELWTIDPTTAAALSAVSVDVDFGSVGLDYHPGQDVLYACSSDTTLYTIEPELGEAMPVGMIGGAGCDNIAAPWGPIACLED